MNMRVCQPGFTLLEMLAASVLLGLLVTLLLSLFNQGEIAWAVGESTAVETGKREQTLTRAAREGANTVFVKDSSAVVRLLSPWDESGAVRTSRPFVRVETGLPEVGRAVLPIVLEQTAGRSAERVEVIVTSAGPDGIWGSEDDLTTSPLEEFE